MFATLFFSIAFSKIILIVQICRPIAWLSHFPRICGIIIKIIFAFLQIKTTHLTMKLSYGIFVPAAQSCPFFFL